jgi:hypothetical protein
LPIWKYALEGKRELVTGLSGLATNENARLSKTIFIREVLMFFNLDFFTKFFRNPNMAAVKMNEAT